MSKGIAYLVLDVAHKVLGEEPAAVASWGTQGDGLEDLGRGGHGHEGCTEKEYAQNQ